MTKDGLSRLLSYMPDPGSREPGATIRCCACRKTYKTASGLVRHLCNFHGAHMDWLAGSELLRARAREFAHTKSKWKKAHQGGTSKPPGPRDGGSLQRIWGRSTKLQHSVCRATKKAVCSGITVDHAFICQSHPEGGNDTIHFLIRMARVLRLTFFRTHAIIRFRAPWGSAQQFNVD